ncbi:UNVERIFIED_CONTAM: hypothetical protein Sangu_2852600 [Sesamum angustifolium]|uniref:Uncharacterized protein n=1 Tax=Sesamum angustifolium TaxID=2727405 RepID=A0AAW2IPG4_9LAMI
MGQSEAPNRGGNRPRGQQTVRMQLLKPTKGITGHITAYTFQALVQQIDPIEGVGAIKELQVELRGLRRAIRGEGRLRSRGERRWRRDRRLGVLKLKTRDGGRGVFMAGIHRDPDVLYSKRREAMESWMVWSSE